MRRFLIIVLITIPVELDSQTVYWEPKSLMGEGITCIDSDSAGTIIAGTKSNGLYRSSDQGDTWTHLEADFDSTAIRSVWMLPNSDVLTETAVGTFYSADYGLTWVQLPENPGPIIGYDSASSIYASHSAYPSELNALRKSTDAGSTWIGFPNVPPQTSFREYSVASNGNIMVADARISYCCRYCSNVDGILLGSPDQGLTFQDIDTGPTTCYEEYTYSFVGVNRHDRFAVEMGNSPYPHRSIRIYSMDFDTVWAFGAIAPLVKVLWNSIDEGIYLTERGELAFQTPFNYWMYLPLQSPQGRCITILYNDYGFMGTDSGLYKSNVPLNSIYVRDYWPPDPDTSSKIFSVDVNYPNPFSSLTTVNYSVPVDGDLTINVYNVLGELITAPVSRFHARGDYTFNWDASTQPSGIYICRVQYSGNVRTQKLIVVR